LSLYSLRKEEWVLFGDDKSRITLSKDRKTLTYKFDVNNILKIKEQNILIVPPKNYNTFDAQLVHSLRWITNFILQEKESYVDPSNLSR
jgi:hypothetical protein